VRVKFCPTKSFLFTGMFCEQKTTHRPGSGVPTWVNSATVNWPFGISFPKTTSAPAYRGVTAKPASRSWLCQIWRVSSRFLLPAVVNASSSARRPSFSQMPPRPGVHPAPDMIASIFDRPPEYCENAGTDRDGKVGTMNDCRTRPSPTDGVTIWSTTVCRSVAYARARRTAGSSRGQASSLSQRPS